jgi:hypothetical protein
LTSKVDQYIPLGYGTIQPVVSVIYPENKTYNETNVPLTFTVDKPTSWVCYSLDGQDNVSIAGNTTLTNLTNNTHNLTVYAKYIEGSVGASETIFFTVDKPEPFLTTVLATASAASVTIVGIGLFYFLRKRKKIISFRNEENFLFHIKEGSYLRDSIPQKP